MTCPAGCVRVPGHPGLHKMANEKACEHCGIPFMAERRRYRFCSNFCARHSRPTIEKAQRFRSKIRTGNPGECWEWQAWRNEKGYGVFERMVASRYAWELEYGPIPVGMCVLHRCDNPPCCNPRHLFLGSLADNNADMIAKNRNAKGEAAGNAKLTEADVLEIRRTPGTHDAIAARFGVSRQTITLILQGRTWAHVPKHGDGWYVKRGL